MLKLYRISKLVKLTKLFRVVKIAKNKKMMASYAQSLMRLSKAAEKIMLFFVISILAYHIISCLWILVAVMSEDSSETNWIKSKGIEDLPNNQKYLYSFYYTITTVTTVGYGDISPTNSAE